MRRVLFVVSNVPCSTHISTIRSKNRKSMLTGNSLARSNPRKVRERRTQSSFRRQTLLASFTWATRLTTRCRMCCAVISVCRARKCSGSQAPTTPVSPRKWWWSVNWRRKATRTAAPWGERRSLNVSGSGKKNQVAKSSTSSNALVRAVTGRASGSRWMRDCLKPSPKSLSRCTRTA